MQLRLLSVNVGLPRIIGEMQGEPVLSGFGKYPVTVPSVLVGATNIAGDAQADLTVHGGADKAVYCYPADNWPWWEREKNFRCKPAAFGENLTVEGADETMIAIGDRFRWGEAILEVCQPRAPCFKFVIFSQRADAAALMTVSGRCGWYCRVVREGQAPAQAASLVLEDKSDGPTVREAFFAALNPHFSIESRAKVASAPALAASWQRAVSRWANRSNS
jgi:MOSC domain-containing protein YiiM